MDNGGLTIDDGHEERLSVGSADKGDAALARFEGQGAVWRDGG
jgi:hypothetical protein